MKAFLLDPPKNSAPMPGFLRLGAEIAGWDIARSDALQAGEDGMEWLARFCGKLEEADIILGLGNFLGLMQAGSELGKLLALLSRKIDSGCPALFDGCSTLLGNAFPQIEGQISGLFGSYGIHLTRTKVASTTHTYEAHSSSMCSVFHKADDALLDPRLFRDVDHVTGSSNRLIQYGSDVFPALEATDMHFFVDEGDLLTVGNLGKKNAVAARLARGKQCLLVLSGSYLRDRTPTVGGHAPGLEDNRKFAENVIEELSERVRVPVNYKLSAYEQFCDLESKLGELIEKVLTGPSADADLSALLPSDVRRRIRTTSGLLDYSKAMYRDLVLVVDDRWSDFEPYFIGDTGFPLARGDVRKQLLEINKLRTYMAHPIKAKQNGWTVTVEDVAKLRRALKLIRMASAQVSQRP